VEPFAAEHPDSVAAQFELGLVLNEAGEYTRSLAAYERALELAPRMPSVGINLLNSWAGLGDLDTPYRRFAAAVADDPFDPVPRMILGRLHMLAGWPDDAVRELREAARLDPTSWTVQQMLCEALSASAVSMLREDWDGAWAMFEDALTEFQRLASLDEQRRAEALTLQAEQSLRMAYESASVNPPLVSSVLGAEEAHVLGLAVAALQEAITLRPERRRPRAALARILQLMTATDDGVAWMYYGRGLADADATDLAIEALERSVDLSPRLAEAHYHLALLLTRITPRSQALPRAARVLAEAVSLDPDNRAYVGALRYVEEDLRAAEEAP
jgi:tetratricopeptide (TPR) repeat protein